MAKLIDFEGKSYEFPDDASEAEISTALQGMSAGPSYMDVVKAIPGEAKRQLASAVAGVDTAIGDVVGSDTMVKRAAGVKKQIQEERERDVPQGMNVLQEGVLQGGASALTQGPAMVVGALAAPVAAPLAVFRAATTAMGLQTGFSKYGDERQAGFQPARSALHGMIEGLIEKYTEFLPLKEVVSGGGLLPMARRYLAKEFAGEQLATLGQDINAKLSDQPDMTLGDYFRDALVTAIATPIAGGTQLALAQAGQTLAQTMGGTVPPVPPTGVVSPTPAPAPITPEPPAVGAPLNAGVASPPLTAGVAPAPITTPKAESTARVYLVGESENGFEVSLNPVQAAAVSENVKYVDLPIDQFMTLQSQVPETRRLEFDGTERFPLPKDPTLVWKTVTEAEPAVPSKPASADPQYVDGIETPSPVHAAIVVPGAVPIRVESTRATAIKFPDKATRALWQYGAALTRYETTTSPADSKKLNALRDAAKEATGITEDAVIADQAQRYTYGVVLTGLLKAKGTHFAPVLETALRAQQTHEKTVSTATKAKVKAGEVALSSDLPTDDPWLNQMHTYLRAWIKTFSPQMRVVILGVEATEGTRARTWYYGGTHYVYVPRQQDKVLALYVLSHEFGHMIVTQHLNDPKYTAQKDKLIAEYAELVSKTGGSAQEFVERFRGPIDMMTGAVGEMETASQFIKQVGVPGITFDEWMADQMVRYMHTHRSHLELATEKAFWKPLFDQLKDFFDRIVKKFAPSQTYADWVESLRMQDSSMAATTMSAPPSPRVDKSVSHETNDQFQYTTRVLDRLPNKPSIKKVTIYGELGRAEVRKEERELIGRILHDWPGEQVDAQLFKERVLGEIVPLSLQYTTQYASYGVGNIGYNITPGVGKPHVVPDTHIWEAKGLTYTSPHFQNDSNAYWAHSRGFDNGQGSWNLIELQSDLEQHEDDPIDNVDEISEYKAQYEDLHYAKKVNREAWNFFDEGDVIGALDLVKDESKRITADVVDFDLYVIPLLQQHIASNETTDRKEIVEFFSKIEQDLNVRQAELMARIDRPAESEVPQNLPKRWWELVLRHEATWASRHGFKTVRMASADTVAKVEGWQTVPDLSKMPPELSTKLKNFQITYTPQDGDSWHARRGAYVGTGMVGAEGHRNGWNLVVYVRPVEDGAPLGGGGTQEEITIEEVAGFDLDLALDVQRWAEANMILDPEMKGIYNRYNNEITKFVKREFGAKEVADDKGNTWLEWDTQQALATMPIVYYNTAKAVADTGAEVAKQSQVPELPETFTRFQGFLQNTLQLNQMAKILPGVVGLQRYRTSMRQLHALKAKLFEGPNDRIHAWHKLGRVQAKRVEQALRDEQLSGNHWTALTQTDVDGRMVWVHIPTASFDKFMRDRGINQEGQELFLGVKNDYLSTLTAMEEVVKKHTQSFFEKNELVLAQRTAQINDEFSKLRATPYLPDMRFGQYSVQVRAGHPETVEGREIKKGELVYWEKFETERARNRRLAELKKSLPGHTVSGSYDSELVSTMRGLPQSVMDAVAETLNGDPTTALTPDQMNALEQIAFDQTAAGKFAKYLGTPAKHVAGSSKDMRRAYAAYHWKTANAIAKLNYFRALTGALNAVRSDARSIRTQGGTSDPYDKLAEYMQNNFTYVMSPTHEFEQLRAFVSLWYLWGSAKTAVMNLTSVPVLTFPYLWARFGSLQSQAALLRSMKDVVQYWKNPEKLSLDRQRLLTQMKADGVTDQSFASMLASVSDGGVAFEKIIPSWGEGENTDIARRMAWKITSMGMMPFRVIEQFNRQITGLAAYDLMVAKTGKTLSSGDTEAYNFARDAVDYTQNEYGAWNRPSIMQGKQSIFLLFFSFVQNMSFLMFGGDKSWWRAMLVLGALAGLQGLPGMDNILDMLNWTARKLSGQHVDLRNEARAVARELGMNPDMVMHGISHNWLGLGWDTSTSIGAGRIIPGTDAIFGVGKFENRFLHATSEIGGPVGSLMLSFLQALADDNPSALLRWDRALPPVVRNIEKTYRAVTDDAWTNARGRPIAEDPTTAELVGQTLGFSPTRRTERSEELRAVKDVVEFYKDRRANLMETVWSARRTHDTEAVRDARVAIAQFNAGVPSSHLRITPEDISSSMKSRAQLDRETEAMRSPQKRYRDIYRYIDELY